MLDTKGEVFKIDNPASLPAVTQIEEVREPIIEANILVPQEHLGSVITLCIEKRGVPKHMEYLGKQVSLTYELPMRDIVLVFFARLKSVRRGSAFFAHQFLRF